MWSLIYKCTVCDGERAWGNTHDGNYQPPDYNPLLLCPSCSLQQKQPVTQRHYWSEKQWLSGSDFQMKVKREKESLQALPIRHRVSVGRKKERKVVLI